MEHEQLFRLLGTGMVAVGLFLTILSALDGTLLRTALWAFYTLCGVAILYEKSDGIHLVDTRLDN